MPRRSGYALTDALDLTHAARRFEHVFLASADGHFTALALRFKAADRPVTLVIGAAKISTTLYRACPRTIYLPIHAVENHPRQARPSTTPLDDVA